MHFIGQLQTNKVRLLVELVDVYETVDRPSLVVELAKRAPGARVLVQVNTTGEPAKGGCRPTTSNRWSRGRRAGLVVDGLMTVGPTEGGPEAARPGFRVVRELCDRLGLAVCSMGMTDDFEVAVQEGRHACGSAASCSACVLLRPREYGNLRRRRTGCRSGETQWISWVWVPTMRTTTTTLRRSRSVLLDRPSPARRAAPRGQRGYQGEYEPDGAVRTMPARPSFPTRDADLTGRRPAPATDDSNVQPRPSTRSGRRRPAPPIRTPCGRVASTPRKRSPTSSKKVSR